MKKYKVVYYEKTNKHIVFFSAKGRNDLKHKIINSLDLSLIEQDTTKIYEINPLSEGQNKIIK